MIALRATIRTAVTWVIIHLFIIWIDTIGFDDFFNSFKFIVVDYFQI